MASVIRVNSIRNRLGFSTITIDQSGVGIDVAGIVTATKFVGALENSGDFTIDDWVVHTGDTDTKFGFPADNQFSVETAGAQRFHIDTDGDALFQATGDNAQFTFKKADAPDGEETVFIDFNRNGTVIGGVGGAAQISGGESGNNTMLTNVNGGQVVLGTGTGGGATSRLRIMNDGRVGIKFTGNYTMNSQSTNLVIGDGGGGVGMTFWTAAGADNQTISFQTNETLSRAEGEISYGPSNTSTTADRHAMMFRTNSGERLRITAAGLIGVNNTAPEGAGIDVLNTRTTAYSETSDQRSSAHIVARNSSDSSGRFASISLVNGGGTQAEGSINLVQTGNYTGDLTFKLRIGSGSSDWRERLRIKSTGEVGINNTPSTGTFTVKNINDSSHNVLECINDNGNVVSGFSQASDGDGSFFAKLNDGTLTHQFRSDNVSYINNTQAFVMGHSSGINNCKYGGSGTFGPRYQMLSNDTAFGHGLGIFNFRDGSGNPAIPAILRMGLSRNDTKGSNGIILNNDTVATVEFMGNDGSQFVDCVRIDAQVDGAPGGNDMPGRLVVLTTADGASTVTEKFRITAAGNVTTCGESAFNRSTAGFTARRGDAVNATRAGGTPLEINRESNDGALVNFFQANAWEGSINVSGSSVSYNGGHLSRWSQLVGISTNVKSDRPTIYQGTVMSNLDAMCEWTGEDNQQLNKTKVSDTVGDKDVAGVFWTWDDDDDVYTNDFFLAMTGDMVIRVAASTTVARGDLLESAGDGTAKPQSDDIVRSKTIAKITSTTSTATYADGSKAYPCVLMAC